MDNWTSAEDIEQVYPEWRQGITPPSITEALSQTTFEDFGARRRLGVQDAATYLQNLRTALG